MDRGVQHFYYTRTLPGRAVAIAKIFTPPTTPASLTDINNTPYSQGDLSVRRALTLDSSPPDFLAPDFNQSITISGSTLYRIYNSFFEITNVLLDDGSPAYYVHTLPDAVDQQVVIIDLKGDPVTTPTSRNGNLLYHTLDGAAYRVRYVDPLGYLHIDLLQYSPVLSIAPFTASSTTYVISGREFTVASNGTYYMRFIQPNGYLALTPYNTQPNVPWYVRIRFGLTPVTPEWATQNFLPQRPYQLATFVPGTVLDPSLIQFERPQMFYDTSSLPSILVFNSDFSIKYALDGSPPGSPPVRGTVYDWKRGLIQFVDPAKGRVQVAVPLDQTDVVYGFYSYLEPDVIYRNIDVNPFTNPAVKNQIIEFYFKSNGADPTRYIYHQVIDPLNGPISGQTNDPAPGVGTNIIFAQVVVGTGIGIQNFTFTDIRTRGGGLGKEWQTIPQAVNFWDLGHWDGKPYPIGGVLAVYVPAGVLNTIAKSDVQSRIQKTMAAGCFAVVHFYNEDGTEFV